MKGFSLMEVLVSLAVFGLGALTIVGLFPLGLREGRLASEDTQVAVAAESVMSRALSCLSDTNLTWNVWRQIAAECSLDPLPAQGDILRGLPSGYVCRLTVISPDERTLGVAVRVARTAGQLDFSPITYSEVRFQGRDE